MPDRSSFEPISANSVRHFSQRPNVLSVFLLTVALVRPDNVCAGPVRLELGNGAGGRGSTPLFRATPQTILLAGPLAQNYTTAMVSDVVTADFDRDGFADLAVAWYATDSGNWTQNLRRLTLLYGNGSGGFTRAPDYNLFSYNSGIPQLSVFLNGTSSIATGDFDGDGDADLAVLPFFGDEMWFLENTGNRTFIQRTKFIFGFNSTGQAISPPEAAAADINRDGRDDLIYLIDPTQHLQGRFIHFWRTNSNMASMQRMNWEGLVGGSPTPWLFNMAVADFDGDSWKDIAFSAAGDVEQASPLLVQWRAFNPGTGQFQVTMETPAEIASDVVAVSIPGACAPSIVHGDMPGFSVQVWDPVCPPVGDYVVGQSISGLSTTALNRGVALATADLDLDGRLDLVVRQRGGGPSDPSRIQLILNTVGGGWTLIQPEQIDTTGFDDPEDNDLLHPRCMLTANLFGNSRPEIVAGFGPSQYPGDPAGLGRLELAIWWNGCLADIDASGVTDVSDLSELLGGMGCIGDGFYRAAADLDLSGCVNLTDLSILLAEFGCSP